MDNRKNEWPDLLLALNATGATGNDIGLALNFELSADGDVPTTLELLPPGAVIVGSDGRSWNNSDPDAIVAAMNAMPSDLVIDYNHGAELKAPKGEEAPAAGWLHNYRVGDGGRILADVKRWTERALNAIKAGEYRYLSPAIKFDPQTLQITRIQSVGLVNKPNLNIPALNSQQTETEEHMLKKLLAKLGLAETATEAEALNALTELQTTALNSQQPDMTQFVPKDTHELALNRATDAEGKLATHAEEQQTTAINACIDQALKDGKIAPANKDYYVACCQVEGGLAQFQEFLKSAPKIAADSNLDGKKLPEGDNTALNAEEQVVCVALGISEEDYNKTQ